MLRDSLVVVLEIFCTNHISAQPSTYQVRIGDTFSGWVAGNVDNEDLLGSIEFASAV